MPLVKKVQRMILSFIHEESRLPCPWEEKIDNDSTLSLRASCKKQKNLKKDNDGENLKRF